MNFEEFLDYVGKNILDFMPRVYEYADVRIQDVTKNNGLVLHGLMIITGFSNIVPTIYLDGLFNDYENGESLEHVMIRIAQSYVEADSRTDIDADMVLDFDIVKSRIVPHLVSLEENAEKLLEIPYKTVNDLAAVFYIETNRSSDGVLKVCITNDLMEMYGVSEDELYDIAVKNLNTFSVPCFKGVSELISKDIGLDIPKSKAEQIYVITNGDRINGSAQILNENLMEQVSIKFGGDFYIIPSSIHEVLAIPVGNKSVEELEYMVREVNSTEVKKEDKLSDSVYAYDSINHEIIFGRDLTSVEEREEELCNKINEAFNEFDTNFRTAERMTDVDQAREAVKYIMEFYPRLFDNFNRMAKKHGFFVDKKFMEMCKARH